MATSDQRQQTRDEPTTEHDCPECGAETVEQGHETVCADCGLVTDAGEIDHGPDWRAFDQAERNAKAHAEHKDPTLYDNGLGSQMGYTSERDWQDARREKLNHHARMGSHLNRGRSYGVGEVKRVAVSVDAGDAVREQAADLWTQAHDSGMMVGRDYDEIAAACVYALARVHQRGIGLSDVVTVARTDRKSLMRGLAKLQRELGLEIPPPKAAHRLRSVAANAGVGEAVTDRAEELLDELSAEFVGNGSSPSSMVAALLWLAGEEITQAEVSDPAGCSVMSVRNQARRIEDELWGDGE